MSVIKIDVVKRHLGLYALSDNAWENGKDHGSTEQNRRKEKDLSYSRLGKRS